MHNKLKNKKAAIELSIGTIVIIVIAMTMLILGLVLVRTIFTGAKYNVDQLNRNVEGEINKLFADREGIRTVIYLPKNQADVKKGNSFGIAFGIKNTAEGEVQAGRFTYKVQAANVQRGCPITLSQADNYLILGYSGSFDLLAGTSPKSNIVKFQAPETAPLCEIQYDIITTKDGQPYDTSFFIVKIK